MGMLVGAPVVISAFLNQRRFARVREILANWKWRWLVYALPFGPAATLVLTRDAGFLLPAVPAIVSASGLFLGSVLSASVAAVWLCIPPDPERPIRMRYTVTLTLALWVLGLLGMVMADHLIRTLG